MIPLKLITLLKGTGYRERNKIKLKVYNVLFILRLDLESVSDHVISLSIIPDTAKKSKILYNY